MLERITLCTFAVSLLSGMPGLADVPVEGLYLIKTIRLKQKLKVKHEISKFSSQDLSRLADCTAAINHGYLTSFTFSTPSSQFTFSTDDYPTPPFPGSKGQKFELQLKSKIKPNTSITLTGSLVYTDEILEAAKPLPQAIDGMPNANIRINNGWKDKEYALIFVFVNAKR